MGKRKYSSKRELVSSGVFEETDFVLKTGERVRIRQLTPCERLGILDLPRTRAYAEKLRLGLVRPRMTAAEAARFLDFNPFRALEILRAVVRFTSDFDRAKRTEEYESGNRKFLSLLRSVGQRRNSK